MASTQKRERVIKLSVSRAIKPHGGRFIKFIHGKNHPKVIFTDEHGSLWSHPYAGSPRTSMERHAKVVTDDVLRHFKGRTSSRAVPYLGG